MAKTVIACSRRRYVLALAALGGDALAQGSPAYPAAASAPVATPADARHFYVVTVHLDGATGTTASAAHPAEAYPMQALPAGGGLLLRPLSAEGNWSVRAFMFQPSQVIVPAGAPVTLTFVGVQGVSFRIAVDGVAEQVTIRRGEIRSVTVPAEQPGIIGFRALDHAPSMTGQILVLPR
ncbi:cupredoxin domain-containing protein [Plastoroseomonas arctica]|uniref:Uncharacterized protein n=1 Tax=Plastoroseomonas arctica TaxID=1509237 RepID=A0AAF1JXY8_9PROT|nr:hypothetical protein [Plastoroseomonas arctica]MBR0654608.1 hypothetical protein [Plastoroseomonas arctica]